MSSNGSCFLRLRFMPILFILPWLLLSCGDGWDAYKDLYSQEQGPPPGEPWVGDETVWVKLGQTEIETPLAGIPTSDFKGSGVVQLSDLILTSGITATPEAFRYDFTATDGYNLLVKRGNDIEKLPSWENMQHGFLHLVQGEGLVTDYEEDFWSGAGSAYHVKFMDGGLIELLTP